jgi:hypothetical protein
MVVEQCNNYDKDPWKGPIGKDGKPARTPSANAAGTDPENPYEPLSGKCFNYHFGQWKKALKDQKGKCIVCFGTARNPDHKTCDCPILKDLGFKLEKRTAADNPPQDDALRVGSDATSPTHGANPPQAPAQSTDSQPGSASIPGAFTASTEHEFYNSGDEFDYEGKADGAMYDCVGKSNTSYSYLDASCRNVTIAPPSCTDALPSHKMGDGGSTTSRTTREPQGVNTIYLPKTVVSLLNNPPAHSIVRFQGILSKRMSLLVAHTGATDHMLPDKSAFISYYPVSGRRIWMGNNSFAPIVGHGTAVISLNGKKILIR